MLIVDRLRMKCGHVFFRDFASFKAKINELVENWRNRDIQPEHICPRRVRVIVQQFWQRCGNL